MKTAGNTVNETDPLSGLTLGVSIVVGAVADILIGVGDLIVCD
jgi:hypothetical protein